MTTIDSAPADQAQAPQPGEPGRLLRTWLQHLDAEVAGILEPWLTLDHEQRPDSRWLRFDGLGPPAAAALLRAMPADAHQRGVSAWAPSSRTLLTAVVNGGGLLTCGGDVVDPSLPTAGVRVRTLTSREPGLLVMEADLIVGKLPDWLGNLPDEAQHAYLQGRQECLEQARTRQAWTRVSTMHGLGDARGFPVTRILRDPAVGEPAGVQFRW